MRFCVDWDGTLVDREGAWLPGAPEALRRLKKRGKVTIFSARATTDFGRRQIEEKLAESRFTRDIPVVAKPEADVYIDDRALRFEGDWKQTLEAARRE